MNKKQDLINIINTYRKRITTSTIDNYSIFKSSELFAVQKREVALLKAFKSMGISDISDMKILEVGCGRGDRLVDLLRFGAQQKNIYGVDIMKEYISMASNRFPGMQFINCSADELPYADESMDMILQYTVYTSIKSFELKQSISNEIIRVLKKGGVVVWYDFRYPSHNKDVCAISSREAIGYFKGMDHKIFTVTLIPPIARYISKFSNFINEFLHLFPILRSHLIIIFKK